MTEAVEYLECGETRSGVARAKVARLTARVVRVRSLSTGLLSVFDQAIVSATSFATAVIIGRTTTQDELGLYYLILSVVLIIHGIQDQVVSAPYTIYSRRRQGRELAEYAGSMWMHHFALTGVVMLCLAVAAGGLSLAGRTAIATGIWVLVGAGPLLMLREGIRRFAFASLRLTPALAIDAFVSVVQLGGLFVLGYYENLTLVTIFAVMGGACGLAALGWYLFDAPSVVLVRKRFVPDWKHNWAFSKWALRSFLAGNTTPYIMPWILSLAVGTAATGVLGACATLVGVTNVFLTGVANVLTPAAAQAYVSGGRRKLCRILQQTAGFLLLTLGSFWLMLLLFADRLTVFVYGDQFEGAGPILVTLGLSALLNGMGIVVGNGLWAIDRARLNFVADVWCVSVTLIAALLLVFPFGALGAALATLAGMAAAAVVRTYVLVRALDDSTLGVEVHSHPEAIQS